MQFDESIVPDRARFRFNLYLPVNNGMPLMGVLNGNPIQYGATWQINWAQVLDQNIPRGCKFLVTHRYLGQSFLVVDPTYNSSFVVCSGLPGVQSVAALTEYQVPGSIINLASLTTNSFNATVFSGQYSAAPNQFVCSNPGFSTSPLSLAFFNIDGDKQPIASLMPVQVADGAHQLTFELVSDE